MPKCPFCKKEINNVKRVYVKYLCDTLYINDETGELEKNYDEVGSDEQFDSYQCPECFSELDFGSDEEVKEFLKGNKKEVK
jgi:uncharacterized protein with PIN domain